MGETSYTALQGKVCVVTLEGRAGTDCHWCLTSVPKELALFGMDRTAESPDGNGGACQEHFYFLVRGSEEAGVELNFELISLSNPADAVETRAVKVRVVPAESGGFAPLDALPDSGDVYGGQGEQQLIKYGYLCGLQDDRQLIKYGYLCSLQEDQQAIKYGYLCGLRDSQQ